VNAVPFMPGYKWHRFARIWRTPVIGELFQGSTTKWGLRLFLPGMPDDFIDSIWDHFDHGTQRAILKLYRSAPADELARAGARLGEIGCPTLVLWGGGDQYLPSRFADGYGEALGGETTVEVVDGAGHWPWIDKPELVERVCAFLS
jgi:pimeloyl-ACP methyl ester carboxylesterase